jgi:hypothetical protein
VASYAAAALGVLLLLLPAAWGRETVWFYYNDDFEKSKRQSFLELLCSL